MLKVKLISSLCATCDKVLVVGRNDVLTITYNSTGGSCIITTCSNRTRVKTQRKKETNKANTRLKVGLVCPNMADVVKPKWALK